MPEAAPTDAAKPLASILLTGYNQRATVGAAVAGVLAQTYRPLEILISDDASSDGTFEAMQQAVAGYAGPHRVRLNRNAKNLGIGAHLSRLVGLSEGAMLFVVAGDDVSLPERCERVMQVWSAADRRPDLIASALIDVDAEGVSHGVIHPADLGRYRSAADWIADPPFVVGAAHAWTRRLFERYGPLPAGVVEDRIMVLRAIGAGGALTLAEPLVRYRRGGVSARARNRHAQEVVERLLANNRAALVELPQLLADAATMGQSAAVDGPLRARLEREWLIRDLFAAPTPTAKLRLAFGAHGVARAVRARLALLAIWPAAYAPFFFAKRLRLGRVTRR